ncbi:MAG: hypothetical protein VCA57_17300 [Pseudomonas sp.]|uniref:hypothetical protein n=1 Tax=Pseudomonas sp. TaxID=306 RepID=UPI0039828989
MRVPARVSTVAGSVVSARMNAEFAVVHYQRRSPAAVLRAGRFALHVVRGNAMSADIRPM